MSKTNQDIEIDLRSLCLVLMKAKYKIIVFLVFTLIIGVMVVTNMTPVYRATSLLLIKSNQDTSASRDSVFSLDSSNKDGFLTQIEILKSRTLSEQVIEELNLATNPAFLPPKKSPLITQVKQYLNSIIPADWLVQIDSILPLNLLYKNKSERVVDPVSKKAALISAFQQKLRISPMSKTQLVHISFTTEDPNLAALIVNSFGDVYIKNETLDQLKRNQIAVDSLKARLNKLRFNFEKSIDDLQAYRNQENLIDLDITGVTSLASSELKNVNDSYLAAKKVHFEAETIYLFVSNTKYNDINSLLSLPAISNHRLIAGIKSVEIHAEKRVSELSFRYGRKHPKLISAKAELAAVRENLQKNVNKLVKGIGKELKAAQDNERRFLEQLNLEKLNFQRVSNKEQEYLKLKREVEANRNLYEIFLERYKAVESTNQFAVQQTRTVDFAEIPSAPIKPKKLLIIVLILLVSFFFAIFLTLLLDSLNDTFRTPTDIESKLGIRLLGLLPLIKLKYKQRLSIYAYFNDKNKAFSEAIRTMRTSFFISHTGDRHKIVLVTSSLPDEGKTTTAINLAFSMARMEKTLLIEADMRRPSFAKIFNFSADQKGLSNVISATGKLADVIVHDKKSNLDILSAGCIPGDSLGLLSSSRFTALLTIMKSKYDRIVIDSSPIQDVSDALVLAQQSDSVIYVVRSDKTKQLVVKQGLSRLLQVTSKIDGVVLNCFDMHKHNKKGYCQGYYEHYGNATKKASKKSS